MTDRQAKIITMETFDSTLTHRMDLIERVHVAVVTSKTEWQVFDMALPEGRLTSCHNEESARQLHASRPGSRLYKTTVTHDTVRVK